MNAGSAFSIVMLLVAPWACAARSPHVDTQTSSCRCKWIARTDGWCGQCRVGYVAGVKIPSRSFFEALDAHGHTIDPATIRCDVCRKNFKSSGFCNECKIGFLRKQAYFSKLTFYVAKGEVLPVSKAACAQCEKHRDTPGWCEECRVGIVGSRVYRIKADFNEAVRLRIVLRKAIQRAEQCLSCALALINDGTCPRCRRTFEDGRAASPGEP